MGRSDLCTGWGSTGSVTLGVCSAAWLLGATVGSTGTEAAVPLAICRQGFLHHGFIGLNSLCRGALLAACMHYSRVLHKRPSTDLANGPTQG